MAGSVPWRAHQGRAHAGFFDNLLLAYRVLPEEELEYFQEAYRTASCRRCVHLAAKPSTVTC